MNPLLQEQGKELQKKLKKIPNQELEKELQKQVIKKIFSSITAIPTFYLELNKYQRNSLDACELWQQGSSVLYEYTKEKASLTLPPVLIVPSLINRHYILDLEENNSFVRYLSEQNIDTYLAAWGEPDSSELEFTLDDYINRICKMVDIIVKKTGKKPILTGYCMGGLLSLAAALEKKAKIQAIAFMATPWDFHVDSFPRFNLDDNNLEYARSFIENYDKIPAAFIQAVFYYLNAPMLGQKFEMFPIVNAESYSKRGFLAVENWINDGISMTKNAAIESFIDWVHHNNVSNLKWKSKNRIVNPEKLEHLPAFFAIPKKDSIVPPACAIGLTDFFPNCEIITPNTGHIGMIVGHNALKKTWEPFVNWVQNIAPTT